MIRIFLGNVGSGKTASAVREMAKDNSCMKYYSNIHTKLKNQIDITADMIINKELVNVQKNGKENFKLSLNKEYWKSLRGARSIIIDEVHNLMDSRRSSSSINQVSTDFLAMARRVLGEDSRNQGDLTLIDQLHINIDIRAREMAHHVRYHICHYTSFCKCGWSIKENSEDPEPMKSCPLCSSLLDKRSHVVEVWCFSSMERYTFWKYGGEKTYYRHFAIGDIQKYFYLYDSWQWADMMSNY